ncbi:MAG TPA: hypothetical protein VKB24_09955 [Candidatus Acidoferrum sp.]|nr:hypothetical protein [Candidatus Acidoferrum sp.]
MPRDPQCQDKHIDPETGIWPVCEWGPECYRGFVRSVRFARGGDKVIKPTNRQQIRKWRHLDDT